jgi:hypothetical protein
MVTSAVFVAHAGIVGVDIMPQLPELGILSRYAGTTGIAST